MVNVLVLCEVEAENGGILVLGVGEVEGLVDRVVGEGSQVRELLAGDPRSRAVAVEELYLTLDGDGQVWNERKGRLVIVVLFVISQYSNL